MSFYSTYQCNLWYRCATHLGHLPDPSHPDHNKLPNFFSPFFYSCLGHIIYPLTLHHDIMPSCVCISMCLFKKIYTKIGIEDCPLTLHQDCWVKIDQKCWWSSYSTSRSTLKIEQKKWGKYRILGRESIMMNTNGHILEKSTAWKQSSILALMIWKLSYF
jgi:hypothetical protein